MGGKKTLAVNEIFPDKRTQMKSPVLDASAVNQRPEIKKPRPLGTV